MDIYHTVIRPLVTEKSTHQASQSGPGRGGAYSFEVHPEANKAQIKDAVEKIYGVKVLTCLLYTSPSPRDRTRSRMPSSA